MNDESTPVSTVLPSTSYGISTNDDSARPSYRSADDELSQRSRNTHTLEVPVLLLFFAWNLSGTVFQNEILYQSCTVTLGYNDSQCDDIQDDKLEIEVSKVASKVIMCRAILESIIPAFLSFFIGPWSDKFGRKPILLSTFLGYFLVYLLLTVVSIIASVTEVSPWYYLFCFIPISMLGGTCALITGVFCYISDISTDSNRAFRMVRVEAAVFVGLLIGSLSSPYLYNISSASVVFGCAALVTFIALIILYKYLVESIKCAMDDMTRWEKFKELFAVRHVAEMYHTCFRRRENHNRTLIWMIIFSLAATIFVLEGSVTLSYLFMRERFNWSVNDYNLYSATNVICQVFGNIFGTYVLSKMFGIHEIVIAIIGYISAMTEYIITGLAPYSWELYAASIIVMLKGVATPMCRSFLATLVPSSEIGKVYALTTTMESLAPIGAAPTYTLIYNFTVDFNPATFNFFSAFVYLICTSLILLVCIVHRRQRSPNYGQLN